MYRIGVDLGGTNIAVGLVDEQHEIVTRVTRPVQSASEGNPLLNEISDCVQEAARKQGIPVSDCIGIGVGTPGYSIDGNVFHAYNLGWNGAPLEQYLRNRFHLPVIIRNDADCAALGETITGAATGCGSALLITLGTGIGGGYVIDGKVCSGHRMLGGEFGHICIQMDGERCSCGERGCWEAYASATALIRQGTAAAAEHPDSLLNTMLPLNGAKVFSASAVGDLTAKAVIQRYTEYIGVGLTSLINALYPEVVLIGGGIADANEALLIPLRSYVESHCFQRGNAPAPLIRKAALGNDAGIIGAASLISE